MAENKATNDNQWNADSIISLIGTATKGASDILAAKQGKNVAQAQAAQAASAATTAAAAAEKQEESKRTTMLIVGGAVSVLALITLLILAKRK